MRKPGVGKILVALLATAAIVIGLLKLAQTRDEVMIRHDHVGTIPITLFAPQRDKPAAVVVIAHGFAGSQQLMQPFALTLARNGYLAITFDFPGHGQNPTPLPADLSDQKAFSQALLDALDEVVDHARQLPEFDGRIRCWAIRWLRISSCVMRRRMRILPRPLRYRCFFRARLRAARAIC